jgi:hypothetical protein
MMGWMPLLAAFYGAGSAAVALLKGETMSDLQILAIDFAKRSF